MKPCPSCGFELSGYATRCSNCGLKYPHSIKKEDSNKELINKKRGERKEVGRGREIGRRNPKTEQLSPQVLELKKQGASIREITRQTGLAKNTVRSILPPSDKHITPKARNVLDKCLANSMELFSKGLHNNSSDDRDKLDAFMETQCEFINPIELEKQMSSWAHQLATVGDNAFVRGVIYALNKTRDYFYSVKELEPKDE